jgi:hypothetical protein
MQYNYSTIWQGELRMPEDNSSIQSQEAEAAPEVVYSFDKSGAAKYATFAAFRVFNSDLFIDFYQTAPEDRSGRTVLCHHLVERIALPLDIVKGFATGLANVVATVESNQNIVLPNHRQASPEDKIKIW